MYPQTIQDVDKCLRAIGVIRIAFGTGALLAPQLTAKSFGLTAKDRDTTAWAGLMGSRALTAGLFSLAAAGTAKRRDGVLLNSGIELFDAVGIAQELRGGRPLASLNGVVSIAFNAASQVVWARARALT